ncbi:6-phospho-3-hexuloisomerase [Paenibacillus rhizovicinus]|uniref:6-phospho-3-hexuloisomerase n=1 Tax=Paenibacillus rhizovicinus TaxID=2704463 RepID=A0A6C0NXS1_9BACL|nr:6-phospho-3-hexuloisomerase [Paenibacillus rhizovicinus]QHW30999.1 6-phospho-3-hexuloisomerase [Paenibacillus rhizovicinus]
MPSHPLTAASAVIQELERTLQAVEPGEIEALTAQIANAASIFVAGAGRSGLMMRAFAMRLMQMGFRAYVVGETVTPGIAEGDLLLIGSGSGETKTLAAMASKAQSIGAAVAAVTIVPESTLGKLAACSLIIPAATKESAPGAAVTSQPMGTLFEQALLLLLDTIVLNLMDRQALQGAAMFKNHANLE